MRRGKIYLVTLSREREKKEAGGAAGDLTHTYFYIQIKIRVKVAEQLPNRDEEHAVLQIVRQNRILTCRTDFVRERRFEF